jgi:ABC-type Fe3+-hydroxamate transport system substrate-binding protein
MITSHDQTGRNIVLKEYPKHIVSVVPSQTELLFDLGLNAEVVGITKFCVHPPEALKTKAIIGGTKNLNTEKIRSLKPDFIIANKEENLRIEIETLASEFPVWVSDIKTLDDALAMIQSIGEITGKVSPAKNLTDGISSAFTQLQTSNLKLEVAYLIWHRPVMTIGSDTFIHHLLMRCGLENVFATKTRYPEISEKELAEANPELILLSSEPFPFGEKHLQHYQQICPHAKIILVDGQMFSWYGSRLLHAPAYFNSLTNSLHS